MSNVGPEPSSKKIGLLKEIAPSSLPVLFNPDNPVERLVLQELSTVALAAGVDIQSVEVRSHDVFPAAFAAISSSRVQALLALGNPINFRGRQLIADFALRSALPSIYDERLFVDAGGLMSYAPSYTEAFRRAATYVDSQGREAGRPPRGAAYEV